MRRKIVVLTLALVAAAAGLGVPGRAVAQATRVPAQEVLPALLIEVRGLRAAMEQMALAGPRVQLALGRLQLQEQRVNTLLRRMETVQHELSGALQESDKAGQEFTRLENALKSGGLPPEERQALESSLPQAKAGQGRTLAKLQRLQAEESGLTQELATEQGRWTDINRHMEELERALTRK